MRGCYLPLLTLSLCSSSANKDNLFPVGLCLSRKGDEQRPVPYIVAKALSATYADVKLRPIPGENMQGNAGKLVPAS